MREILFYSGKAKTTGNIKDLMKAGRMDIVCHTIIHSFFLSHTIRDNTKLHLIFDGPPDPPKHLEIISGPHLKEFFSKKDVLGLIKRMLYKSKKDKKVEAFKKCFVEKKSFQAVLKEINQPVFLLDKSGQSIRKVRSLDGIFVLGDDDGIPKDKRKWLRKQGAKKISLGPRTYFTSQSVVILQNELDLREI